MKYPHLHEILSRMAVVNDDRINQKIDWSKIDDVDRLEQQAKKLDKMEREAIADGEQANTDALVKQYGVQELADFLDEAFDGDYHDVCFRPFKI